MIMYEGSVVEAGTMQEIIQQPNHPYTQLLIDSVPQPNPKTPWGSQTNSRVINQGLTELKGCKFADRCPAIMDMCNLEVPALFQIRKHVVAGCFLYRDSKVMDNTDIASSFAEKDTILNAAN
jgi:peptide/nickel transport system ATP-binding protein